MHVAYLVNQYPKVSHSFVRREIAALEALGAKVSSFAIRGWGDVAVDPADQAEQVRTRYLLKAGLLGLIPATLACLLTAPGRFWRALWLALQCSRGGDRPWPIHLVYLAEACKLRRWLRRDSVDHLHAHFGTNSAEVAMLAHVLGGPGYSFTVHGPEEFDKPGPLHLARKMQGSRFVVAISSFGRSQLWRWLTWDQWSKVKVVHCGLEAAFHDVPLLAVPTAPRLVCVGRLCEQKGQLLLIEALRRLRDEGCDLELVLAGDGEMRPDIERLVGQYGLQQQVRITGWISAAQVRTELQASRALVLPSFAEGLPVVLMEAMALERPVLSTYVAGIPELVIDEQHGWLFPAGDIDALASAMKACLNCPGPKLQAMGQQARIRVLERHQIEVEAAKLLKLFENAVAEGNAA